MNMQTETRKTKRNSHHATNFKSSKEITNLKLIDGVYQPAEAKEMLMSIFSDKINFLKIKNWSSVERTGKSDSYALNRIEQLSQSSKIFAELVSNAQMLHKKLVIKGHIEVSLEE